MSNAAFMHAIAYDKNGFVHSVADDTGPWWVKCLACGHDRARDRIVKHEVTAGPLPTGSERTQRIAPAFTIKVQYAFACAKCGGEVQFRRVTVAVTIPASEPA